MSGQLSEFENMIERDQAVVWHPYASMVNPAPVYPVSSASGVRIRLAEGTELIDGMSSWWSAIHGYNHPVLNGALTAQLEKMAHVMFGGLTHEPAIGLAEELIRLAPSGLDTVFFSDSGSVAVEVAMKMAVQYWSATNPEKQKFLTISNGYHGDTIGAMAVCDPVTGMHTLFSGIISQQVFADRPRSRFDQEWDPEDINGFAGLIARHHEQLAAVILEPVVQGAGGMWFYHPEYLLNVRRLCDEYGVLLILDEIATGFGRSGRMFACEHAEISPDIMCVGKALTGGYMTLAATLARRGIAEIISADGQGAFMHGPTFMANPLACAVALANLKLLQSWQWREKVLAMEAQMHAGLQSCRLNPLVTDVRVLGAIAVVELGKSVNLAEITRKFVGNGVWVRPFGRLVYIMPPYIIDSDDLDKLTGAICKVITEA